MNNFVVCHYGEIALKGKNRKFFEEQLKENIKRTLKKGSFRLVKRISGRIIIELTNSSDQEEVKKALLNVFGLANFAFAIASGQNIKELQKIAFDILAQKRFKSFAVKTTRAEKGFALTSQEINEQLGAAILKKLKVQVDLTDPDIILFVEIVEKFAFLYTEKINGLGGLPVGVSGKAICLLSGGIDSPVAGFLAMKRGVKIIFAHFHAFPYVDKASVDKVKDIALVLSRFQGLSMVYCIPFGEIQKEVLLKTKEKLRVVLYRRLMLKIAQVIAQKEKASALVTGENIGQVASQTLPNLSVIEKAVSLPIIRPLITFDKQEIIEKAKKIGTFNLSVLPHQDCCSRFLPAHPETKAQLSEVMAEEKKLALKTLTNQALKKTEVIKL